jgi:hypothetical protein
MAIKHMRTCSHCNKEFEWFEFAREHATKPGNYDVVDLSRVGSTMPKDDGGFYIIARCYHCGKENKFDM